MGLIKQSNTHTGMQSARSGNSVLPPVGARICQTNHRGIEGEQWAQCARVKRTTRSQSVKTETCQTTLGKLGITIQDPPRVRKWIYFTYSYCIQKNVSTPRFQICQRIRANRASSKATGHFLFLLLLKRSNKSNIKSNCELTLPWHAHFIPTSLFDKPPPTGCELRLSNTFVVQSWLLLTLLRTCVSNPPCTNLMTHCLICIICHLWPYDYVFCISCTCNAACSRLPGLFVLSLPIDIITREITLSFEENICCEAAFSAGGAVD